MSDSEDADLEFLRQAALSSLLKKKSDPLQTNAVFYRPVTNSNLISIQPVVKLDGEDEREENSDGESSSGSEYAVIEEGLSVSSGDVDQVIEEIIVSGEESEDEAEDAVSIASKDSFDEILNSVEEEMRTINKPQRTRKNSSADISRKLSSTEETARPRDKRKLRSRSPISINISPPPKRKFRFELDTKNRNRRLISPIENRNPRSLNNSRRSHSPLPNRRRLDRLKVQPRRSSTDRRPGSRNSRSRSKSTEGSDKSNSRSNDSRRPNNRRPDNKKSRSKSPRNLLSFGDHKLRTRRGDNSRPSSRNSSRHQSQERTRSPVSLSKRKRKSNTPEDRKTKNKSPSPVIDISKLSEDDRRKLEKRKLKFQSKVSHSGKVILKPKENTEDEDSRGVPSRRGSKVVLDVTKPKITSRLGSVLNKVIKKDERRSKVAEIQTSSIVEPSTKSRDTHTVNTGGEAEDSSNNNFKDRPSSTTALSSTIGKEDLRTKLQQKRAANVGRLFSSTVLALKDALHKESSSTLRSSTSP